MKFGEKKSTDSTEFGVEMNAAIEAQFGGPFEGWRTLHSKGVYATGVFEAADGASEFCVSPMFSPGTHEVLARWSNGDGCPHAADGTAFSFGFAIKMTIPDAGVFDLLAVDSPTFTTDDGAVFLDFVRALTPTDSGRPSAVKTGKFALEHPRTFAATIAKSKRDIGASFATQPWWVIHALYFRPVTGPERAARLRWEPVDGVSMVKRDTSKEWQSDHLVDEIRERLASGSVAFDLIATLAEAGDPLDDAATEWPPGRSEKTLGRVTLTQVASPTEQLRYVPDGFGPGIRNAGDRLLDTRAVTYQAAWSRRAGQPLPEAMGANANDGSDT